MHGVPHPLEVETQPLPVAQQVADPQRPLVGEQQIVHLPERTLVGGGLGRLSRQLRVRVDVVQR